MSGRILTVAQQKGGSGKTTLAAHLAVALAKKSGEPVAILDVDPQGSLGTWFEAREDNFGEDNTGLEFRTASGWAQGVRRVRSQSPMVTLSSIHRPRPTVMPSRQSTPLTS